MHPVPPRSSRLAVRLGGLLVLALALGGCETIAITALGIGSSAGLTHTVNGTSARTFTAPDAKVKAASLAALGRMGAAVDAIDRVENGELIRARSADRSIEHNVSRVNQAAQLETTDFIDEFRLVPWLKWMEKVDFDSMWEK